MNDGTHGPPKSNAKQPTIFTWEQFIFWLLAGALLLHSVAIIFLASVPPISRDALNHHLAIPKMYLQHGGIYELPSMHFSYFPMDLDLLYLLPLSFNFDIAAKYIHFLFAMLTAGLLYRYLQKATNRIYGLLGALLFLTTPVIVKLSVTAYVDLGLIFFSWACLYSFLQWRDNAFKLRHLATAGIACGLALGTKYNGLILLLIMAAMIPLAYSRTTNRNLLQNDHRERNTTSLKGLQWGAIFILIALIVFSPWMIRNTVWKHNPLYPLYNSVFNPPDRSIGETTAPPGQDQPRNAFWQRKSIYNETLLQTVSIPIRAFFQGEDDNPQFFDGKLNPCLLLLPMLAFIRRKEDTATTSTDHRNLLAIFSALFVLFVLFESDFRIRYMAPAIPPLVALAGFGAYNVMHFFAVQSGWRKKIGLGGACFLLTCAFAYNGSYIYDQFLYIRPLDYLTGKVTRDGYVSRYRIEHPVMVQANKILPKDARVLCLSIGDRTYYLDRAAHLAEDFFDRTNGAYTGDDIVKKMMRYGTTHIILNRDVYLDWASQLKAYEQAAFEDVFDKHTKLLYEKDGVQLLEIINNH